VPIRFQTTRDNFLFRSFSLLFALLQTVLTVLFGCLFILIASEEVSAKPAYTIRPPQPWVRAIDLESEVISRSGPAASTFLLDDHQIKLSEKTAERYYHQVQKVETAAGLSDLSQLRFYFEPSFQQLAIHFIRIRRNGALIDALKPSEIKVIQQEEELNQQLYNGTLAALMFLNDLRVGDIVDYAYTVSGENPVLGGRFAETLYLADRQPIQHLHFRLLSPSGRMLAIKNSNIEIAPRVQSLGSDSEYIWERREVAAINVEDGTPDWFNPYPTVSLSEFRSWSDVVQWALPLYGSTNPMPPELISKIQEWRKDYESPEQRAVPALRFVQDEIRYLGIELGRYSHQPTSPARVFARRFGDCKDKSLLLATILKSMGIDAAPALVHSSAGRSLDQKQPSPFEFDHVIVQAKMAGKTYWLDPTMSYQRGELDKYYDPNYERALVLRAGTGELEKIPLPSVNSGSIVVKETYEGNNGAGRISLQVNTTYLGAEADTMRYYLSGSTLSELSKTYLNFYGEANPSIKAEGLPQVEDDQITNTILVKEHYLIDGFWKDNKHRFLAEKIYAETGKPSVTQRSMPLSMRYPLSINQTIEVNLSERPNIDPERGTIANDALKFDYSFSTNGNALKLEYSLRTLANFIPVQKVPQHLLVLDRLHNFVGFELTNGPDAFVRFPSERSSGPLDLVVGLIVVVAVIGIVSVFLIRNRLRARSRSKFGKELKAKVGFAPETAIRVSHETDIDPALRQYKCSCGETPYTPESPPERERFTYDGQGLIGIRLHCSGCRRNTDLYFNPRNNQAGESPSLMTT
jgi:hypothetical protein